MMLSELDNLKKELDLLVEKGASKEEIYKMSVKIDKALVDYYKDNELGKVIN